MAKDTSKIVEELMLCPDFTTFYNQNSSDFVNTSLCDLLDELITKNNLKKSVVIKNSELSEVYAYQIFSGLRKPERNKLLCLAIGMSLNVNEVQNLLKCAGYATLYVKNPFDSIVLWGIHKGLTVVEINQMLFKYNLETLG